jgi:membrane associated rhomboid family serine protease
MIPIRDENPSGTTPVVTVVIILTNVLVFIYEVLLGVDPDAQTSFIYTYGLVPQRVWRLEGTSAIYPFFTAMFLHGGLLHLVANMWYLWIFGDNIEDRLGHATFAVFYAICGVAASLVHVLLGGAGTIPMVGASGAIAGVLGAYFICFPRARVLTLVPIYFYPLFVRLPAWLLLVIWFVGQIWSAVAFALQPGVAWWAHVGGFVVGATLIMYWPKCERSRQAAYVAYPDARRRRTYDDF